MTRFLLAGAAAFGMMTGAAMAQTSTSETTTTTTTMMPQPVSPPVIVKSSGTVGHAVLPDGDQTSTSGTSATDSNGAVTKTTITNQSYPFSNMIMSTKKTDTTVNGVTTETVTTTQSYPGTSNPPVVTTATNPMNPDAK